MTTKRMLPLAMGIGAVACYAALVLHPPKVSADSKHALEVSNSVEVESAFELIGRSDQSGSDITHYGYVTHINGLPDEALFSDATTRTEATARFTYLATTTLHSRHLVGNILTTAGLGTLTIFFRESAGADFGAPDSFKEGRPAASFALRYHSVLNVQTAISPESPGRGIVRVVADLHQETASPLELGGRWFHLGHRESRERLSLTGQGTLTRAEPPQAFFFLGGEVVASEQ